MPSIVEVTIEDLALQHAGGLGSDGAQLLQLGDAAAWSRGVGGLAGGWRAGSLLALPAIALALDDGDLLLENDEALDLAADLGGQAGRQRTSVAGDERG